MKTKVFLIIVVTVLIGACPAQADTVWLSGHHEVVDGDVHGEIWMYNDATADIWGGDIIRLAAFDVSSANVFGGQMDELWVGDDTTVNIYGGALGALWSGENGLVYLYAYDVAYHPTGGGYWGDKAWIEGKYYINNNPFNFLLYNQETYSHINLITVIDAEIEILPNTLNLESEGTWLTCRIRLPEGYSVSDIDPGSILLERRFKSEWKWFNEKQNVVKAKFKRSELKEILEPGEIELIVSCHLLDGTYFEGKDAIKVIDKGRLRRRRVNSNSKVEDGIEYYIQTDKSIYTLGENVEMLYRVTNLRDEEWRVVAFFPIMDIIVEAREGKNFNEIWHWSWDKIHPTGPIVFRLEPGESVEINGLWPQIDLHGSVEPEDHTHVPPGRYRISGVFYPTDSSIAVDITIVKRKS